PLLALSRRTDLVFSQLLCRLFDGLPGETNPPVESGNFVRSQCELIAVCAFCRGGEVGRLSPFLSKQANSGLELLLTAPQNVHALPAFLELILRNESFGHRAFARFINTRRRLEAQLDLIELAFNRLKVFLERLPPRLVLQSLLGYLANQRVARIELLLRTFIELPPRVFRERVLAQNERIDFQRVRLDVLELVAEPGPPIFGGRDLVGTGIPANHQNRIALLDVVRSTRIAREEPRTPGDDEQIVAKQQALTVDFDAAQEQVRDHHAADQSDDDRGSGPETRRRSRSLL